MKWIIFLFTLPTANDGFAKQYIMDSVYLADRVAFDDELSIIGEFGVIKSLVMLCTHKTKKKRMVKKVMRHQHKNYFCLANWTIN